MTVQSGMRRRNVPQRQSTPQGQTRSSDPVAPVALGGTSGRTPAEARTGLDVPGLADNNVFTGVNTFGGLLQNFFATSVLFTGNIEQDGDNTAALGYVEATTLDVSGVAALSRGLMLAYVAKTADYTPTSDDIVVDVTSGSPTITLPTAVGSSQGGSLSAGRMYIIKNSGAGTVTLATTSSQTIDGAAPGTLAAGGVIRLVSTGSNWISV